MREGEWQLEGFYAGREEVEGHADLRAEAGGDAGEGVEGRREQGALARERFGGGVTRAAEDGASGEVLHQAKAAAVRADGGRKSGDGSRMISIEGVEEGGKMGRRGSKVSVGEKDGFRFEFAGADEAKTEGVALAAPPSGWGGGDDLGLELVGDLGRRVSAAVVGHDEAVEAWDVL